MWSGSGVLLTNAVALTVEEADSKAQGEAARRKVNLPLSLSAGDACQYLCVNEVSVTINLMFEHSCCCHRHRQQLKMVS